MRQIAEYFRLDPETNVLSLASFVLSLLALGHQVIGWAAGPKARMHPPSTVNLRVVPTTGEPKLDLYATSLGFTNSASPAYPEIITEVGVEFQGPGNVPVALRWWAFEQTGDALASDPEVFSESKAVAVSPQVVSGGGAIGHSTIFIPFPTNCEASKSSSCHASQNYLTLDGNLAQWAAQGGMKFTFTARILGSNEPLKAACIVPKESAGAIAGRAKDFERRRWIALTCDSTSA